MHPPSSITAFLGAGAELMILCDGISPSRSLGQVGFGHGCPCPPALAYRQCIGGGGGRLGLAAGRAVRATTTTRMMATKEEEEAAKRGGRKGFYVRPSKAVELGGGFYVPGLEGPKLRMALSAFAIAMLALNRAILPGFVPQQSQNISEVITAVTTLLLLGQALAETFGVGLGAGDGQGGGGSDAVEEGMAASAEAAAQAQSSARLDGAAADNELWLVASALQVCKSPPRSRIHFGSPPG
jgi:hypothetical protein